MNIPQSFTTNYDKLSISSNHTSVIGRYGYVWQVQSGGTNLAAFKDWVSLCKWLHERHLFIEDVEAINVQGRNGYSKIKGIFKMATHIGSYDTFYALAATPGSHCIRVLSNGDITLGVRTTDEVDGSATIHTLNPNMRYRPVYKD